MQLVHVKQIQNKNGNETCSMISRIVQGFPNNKKQDLQLVQTTHKPKNKTLKTVNVPEHIFSMFETIKVVYEHFQVDGVFVYCHFLEPNITECTLYGALSLIPPHGSRVQPEQPQGSWHHNILTGLTYR